MVLLPFHANADIVDYGYSKQAELSTKHYANGFTVFAELSDNEFIGLGSGFIEKGLEMHYGAFYADELGAYTHVIFKPATMRLDMDLDARLYKEEYELNGGLTYYFSENWGVRLGYEFTDNVFYAGFRKTL